MARKKKDKWLICGLPACGKTSLIHELANLKSFKAFELCDLDELVLVDVKKYKNISDLIAKEGWDFFRQKEESIIDKTIKKEKFILALGGGSLTQQLLANETLNFICLNLSANESWERIKDDKNRPLRLKGREQCLAIFKRRDELFKKVPIQIKMPINVLHLTELMDIEPLDEESRLILGNKA